MKIISSQIRSRLGLCRIALVFCAFIGTCWALVPSAQAIAIYDASIFVSVSTGPNLPPGVSFELHPGATLTPPPFPPDPPPGSVAMATRNAVANVPGQVFATVHGVGSYANSSASAFGFGSLVNHQGVNVSFPILVTPHWSISVEYVCCGADMAAATVRSRILLDDVEVVQTSDSKATAGAPFPHSSVSLPNHVTTPLTLNLEPGSHGLTFTAEASGLASPEPTTLVLMGTTAAGLGLARWRQQRRKRAAESQHIAP